MREFVLHPEAYTDLDEIWEYIAAENLGAADRVLEEIYEAIRLLVDFPYQGHRRPDLTSSPLRFQTLRNYVIAYTPDDAPRCTRSSTWPPQSPSDLGCPQQESLSPQFGIDGQSERAMSKR